MGPLGQTPMLCQAMCGLGSPDVTREMNASDDFPHMRDVLSPFDSVLETMWLDYHPDHARARIVLRDDLQHPYGGVHGGVIHALVEGLCTRGTLAALVPQGKLCLGQAIEVSLLRPVSEGFIEARAVARHRGRSSWVWAVDVIDPRERLCALGKVTVAVRERSA